MLAWQFNPGVTTLNLNRLLHGESGNVMNFSIEKTNDGNVYIMFDLRQGGAVLKLPIRQAAKLGQSLIDVTDPKKAYTLSVESADVDLPSDISVEQASRGLTIHAHEDDGSMRIFVSSDRVAKFEVAALKAFEAILGQKKNIIDPSDLALSERGSRLQDKPTPPQLPAPKTKKTKKKLFPGRILGPSPSFRTWTLKRL